MQIPTGMAVSSSMGHGGYNGTMPRIAGALVVLLLVLEATLVSSARSLLARRGLLGFTDKPSTIEASLMHVHHHDSPYMHMQPNLTLTERVQISVANSKRRLQTTSAYSSPLESTQGEYIMQITVGTPARTFVANADTGSDLVWLQCSNCTNCVKIPDDPFDPTASSTYSAISCTAAPCQELYSLSTCLTTNICAYNYSYGDKSFTYGDMAYETFTFTSSDGSSESIPNIAFGCGTQDEGLFSKTDGLVGLGQGPLSLVSQLGNSIGSVFSYCLVDYYAATTQTSPLLLGSVGTATKIYTPIVSNSFYPTYYYINLMDITVNGQSINYPSDTFSITSSGTGGIIVDSGTTVTRLFDAAYVPLKSSLSALISYPTVDESNTGFDLCYDTSSVSSPVFPTVVFQFENVDVSLPDGNTFLAIDNQGTYCLAFLSAGSSAESIFGNVQQQNFEIAFDIGNKQLGFAATTCS